MLFPLLLACADPPAATTAPRWPRPGDAALVEVVAALDGHGHATGWTATAGTPLDEQAKVRVDGCELVAEPAAAGSLAAVDVTAPAVARLSRRAPGPLTVAGPMAVADARWSVGDVDLLRDDGSRVHLPEAIRFGDAPDVVAVRSGLGGDLVVRFERTADETVEVLTHRRDGREVRCTGGAEGFVSLPEWALDPAHPEVRVRAVRETLSVAQNAAILRVRAVVERVLSLEDPVVSERAVPRPPPTRRVWEPKKVLRVRENRG